MVIVGHSMGGLLTKMMVQDSGTRLWQVISDRPVDELAGDPADRDLFRRALIFKPRPEVRRVVFIATPHRGQPARSGRTGAPRLAARSPRRPAPRVVRPAHRPQSTGLLQAELPQRSAHEHRRTGMAIAVPHGPGSVRHAPTIETHSIIADRRDPPRAGGTDGLVPYESAHLDGTTSEFLVSSGHQCQDNPAVIREIRRILLEHAVR